MTTVAMTLTAFLDNYYLLERSLCKNTGVALHATVRLFERFLGRPATLDDLVDQTVSRWIVQLEERGLAQWTVRGNRQRLIAIWNAAWMHEPPLVPSPPRRVRRVRRPRIMPEAWTAEQVEAIATAGKKCRGVFRLSRVSRSAFWSALVMVAWDSGLRLSDLLALRFADVGADGRVVLLQGKTGRLVRCKLSAETLQAIDAIRDAWRETIFGGAISRRRFYERFKQIVRAAGLPRGTSRWLRRSSGTAVECKSPGAGHRHLGNSREVFEAHYCDPRLVELPVPSPGALKVEALPLPERKARTTDRISALLNEYLHEYLPTVAASPLYVKKAEQRLQRIVGACKFKRVADLDCDRFVKFLGTLKDSHDLSTAYAGLLARFVEWLHDSKGCTELAGVISRLRPLAVNAGQRQRRRAKGGAS
jgi:integrase